MKSKRKMNETYGNSRRYTSRKLWLMLLLLMITFILSLFIGRVRIPLLGFFPGFELTAIERSVFYYIRLPRVILVTGVGAALSLAGASYQSIFRNPLVSPDILGVSAGAGFGAALGMLIPGGSLFTIYVLAFIFGIVAVFLAYGISSFGKVKIIMMLVLAGIVVSSLFNAFISILKYLADPFEKLPGIVFWLMGGFSRTGWREVGITLPFVIFGVVVLMVIRWHLNVIPLGDEEAISMGVNVRIVRSTVILINTLMVAASVATVGQVSWVGLVIPHIARFLVGANHRYMLPATALSGSIFLLLMDDLARSLTGAEIPISIVTSLLGAPFFAYLLISGRGSGWN